MTVYQIEYVVCPWCEGQSGRQVDHLYVTGRYPCSFGPWDCDLCKLPFSGQIIAPGNVTAHKLEDAPRQLRAMVLLRMDGDTGPVFFVLDHKLFKEPGESNAKTQSAARRFFEAHSCPSNWMDECVAVIHDGDSDPHGFLSFVRIVKVPEDFNPDDDEQWPALFPEAFHGTIIEGAAARDD